jgi:hypothetical protein
MICLKKISLGVAAAGLLRLLLLSDTYSKCKGGATLLTSIVVNTTTNSSRGVTYGLDTVRNWQVCVK